MSCFARFDCSDVEHLQRRAWTMASYPEAQHLLLFPSTRTVQHTFLYEQYSLWHWRLTCVSSAGSVACQRRHTRNGECRPLGSLHRRLLGGYHWWKWLSHWRSTRRLKMPNTVLLRGRCMDPTMLVYTTRYTRVQVYESSTGTSTSRSCGDACH